MKNNKLDAYIYGKNEIGQIATAIDSLYESFEDIVGTLSRCSDSLTQSSTKMSDSSKVLLQCVEENSDVTAQFAHHTEAITGTVQQVELEVNEIAETVSHVENQIEVGARHSRKQRRMNYLQSQMQTMRMRSLFAILWVGFPYNN